MKVALLDSRDNRRAQISHAFSKLGIHVEPCDNYSEWVVCAKSADLALVSDRGEHLRQALSTAGATGNFLPVIAYRTAAAANRIVDAIRAGAADYFTDLDDASALADRVRNASRAPDASVEFSQRCLTSREKTKKLTPRERQVLDFLAQGKTNKHIGKELDLSHRTVEIHRSNMLGKLDVASSAGAVRIAVEAEYYEKIACPTVRIES